MTVEDPSADLLNRVYEYAQGNRWIFLISGRNAIQGYIWETTEGRIKKVTTPYTQGFGFRALVKGGWGFATATTLSWEELRRSVDRADYPGPPRKYPSQRSISDHRTTIISGYSGFGGTGKSD